MMRWLRFVCMCGIRWSYSVKTTLDFDLLVFFDFICHIKRCMIGPALVEVIWPAELNFGPLFEVLTLIFHFKIFSRSQTKLTDVYDHIRQS